MKYEKMVEDFTPKILLVDDEKEFVLTLSERLETRNLGSAIAYDGEEALAIMETDTPDVMVLDLKMPGIDGMETLRQINRKCARRLRCSDAGVFYGNRLVLRRGVPRAHAHRKGNGGLGRRFHRRCWDQHRGVLG